MTATIECAMCGRKIFFDCHTPICPENDGWREIPICEASVEAWLQRRTESMPVCPECLESQAKIRGMWNRDPIERMGGKF